MNCCYIIYSPSLNRFYVGATHNGHQSRLEKHNSAFYGKKHFTSKANDWEVFLFIESKDYSHAIRIEGHIKKMKSKVYIQNLKKYTEMRLKLYQNTLSI